MGANFTERKNTRTVSDANEECRSLELPVVKRRLHEQHVKTTPAIRALQRDEPRKWAAIVCCAALCRSVVWGGPPTLFTKKPRYS